MKGVSNPKARIVSGTYTGDGAGTQAITGVGFQPDAIFVFSQLPAGNYDYYKDRNMGLNARILNTDYQADVIISLDADGFTVGDTQGINVAARLYSYLALKN